MTRQTKPKREQRLAFRLTSQQLEAYLAAAKLNERDLSDWIRRVLDREASAVVERKAVGQ